MKYSAIVAFCYGALLLLGGIMGYAKANSLVSLIMGSVSALLAFAGGYMLLRDAGLDWGYWLMILVSGALTGVFAYRFIYSYKIFPPGIMALVSLIVFIFFLVQKARG